MTVTKKDPVLVVLQLSGGNDYMNTLVPYTDANYWDNRKGVALKQEDIIDLDGKLGVFLNGVGGFGHLDSTGSTGHNSDLIIKIKVQTHLIE
mgnify:CR=1 FL=1